MLLSNIIIWCYLRTQCYHLLLSSHAIIWCYHPYVIIWYYHTIVSSQLSSQLSSHVIIPCYPLLLSKHPMLSSHTIISLYHLMLLSDVIIPVLIPYGIIPLLSYFVTTQCHNLLLSFHVIIQCCNVLQVINPCYHLMLSTLGDNSFHFIIPENFSHSLLNYHNTN
jgi:hypothetical protein